MDFRFRLPFTAFLTTLLLGLGACVDEFDLGVGAFEVGQDRAILWTHIVPANPAAKSVTLSVSVATDPDFNDVVRRQSLNARARDGFTTRVLVPGLQSATQYYYRFSSVGAGNTAIVSPTGAFRTAPQTDDGSPVRFVISGDSNLGYTSANGFNFYVLSAAADEDPDFFVYFGDTIYADSGVLPGGADAFTLDEYREVHRLTRADAALQELIAATGTFSGWDDHEVRNDYDGETVDPVQFENGAQAFFEYLPLRQNASGPPFRIDRSVRWGKHVELFFLDGRQFRSAEQFCNPDPIPDGPLTPDTLFSPFVEDEVIAIDLAPAIGPLVAAALLLPSDPVCAGTILTDPTRTILGAQQLADLKQALLASTARFKIIINNTPIASLLVTPYDRWEGYLAERQDLLDFIGANFDADEVLVLTTDFHTNLAIQRSELTEVIVGPIGQTTFATSVAALTPPPFLPFLSLILNLFQTVVDVANGPPQTPPLAIPGTVIGSEPDAFSYGVVDVFEDAGQPVLRYTARGNTSYLLGANDPADVMDLFTFEMRP